MSAIYTANVHVTGGRNGHARSSDGLIDFDLALPKALGGKENATNPEQLFAAGYAACFQSALAFIAKKQGAALTDSAIDARVSLHDNGAGGFKLAVALDVETAGLDQAGAESLVAAAHQVCPYSNAVRGNVDVAITVKAR